MATPSERAEQREESNPYPENSKAGRYAYRVRQEVIRSQFAQDLHDEYTADMGDEAATIIFLRAWEEGHREGYRRVEENYEELAEFVRKVVRAK